MKKFSLSPKLLFIFSLIFLAAFSRLMPHLPNFTPIAAMALFSGSFLTNKKLAFLIPILSMLISDFFIGFHSQMWSVYVSFIIMIFLGINLSKNTKLSSITGHSVLASLIFFIITNFGVWLSGEIYPLNSFGLITCYSAAIPFFGYSLLGDLFYCTLFFGSYSLLNLSIFSKNKA